MLATPLVAQPSAVDAEIVERANGVDMLAEPLDGGSVNMRALSAISCIDPSANIQAKLVVRCVGRCMFHMPCVHERVLQVCMCGVSVRQHHPWCWKSVVEVCTVLLPLQHSLPPLYMRSQVCH